MSENCTEIDLVKKKKKNARQKTGPTSVFQTPLYRVRGSLAIFGWWLIMTLIYFIISCWSVYNIHRVRGVRWRHRRPQVLRFSEHVLIAVQTRQNTTLLYYTDEMKRIENKKKQSFYCSRIGGFRYRFFVRAVVSRSNFFFLLSILRSIYSFHA